MFCPKCGTKNPEDGKFCRKCGTDIEVVSEAISGNLSLPVSRRHRDKRSGKPSWESAVSSLFTGIGFLIVSIVLSFQPMGSDWWFWMLIPAFGMMGSGVAKIIRLRQMSMENQSIETSISRGQISSRDYRALPPDQTDYVSPDPVVTYKTGDLVPSSVTEKTTRHLKINSESETINLPKTEK